MIEFDSSVRYLRRIRMLGTQLGTRHCLAVQMVVYATEPNTATIRLDGHDVQPERIQYPLMFGHLTALFKGRARWQDKSRHGYSKRYLDLESYIPPKGGGSTMEIHVPVGYWRLPPVCATYIPNDFGRMHFPVSVNLNSVDETWAVDCFIQAKNAVLDDTWEESHLPSAVTVSQRLSGGITDDDLHVYRQMFDGQTKDFHVEV